MSVRQTPTTSKKLRDFYADAEETVRSRLDMVSFKDGVLTLDHLPSSNFSEMNVSGRVRAIREIIAPM